MRGNAIEPQIRWPRAFNALPKDVFHREDVYRLELERIFYGPEWHPLAHGAEIPARGDFKTGHVGAAPVLIVRGDDDRIRVFYNSCPHRGTQLKTCARGSGAEIECPYHRWLFDMRGRLLAASGSDDFPASFRKEDYGLRALRSAELHGLVFATCSDEAPDLPTYLGEAADYVRNAFGGDGRLRLIGYQKVAFATNWKEYADNEGYHAPLLHRAFRQLRWQGAEGTQGVTRYGHKVLEAELREAPEGYLNDQSLVLFREPSERPRSIVTSIWPMTVIVKHMDVINIRFAFPRSRDETEVHYAYFSRQDDAPELAEHRVRQASNLLGPSGFISLEDGAVFNRLHVGLNSFGTVSFQKGYRGGTMTGPFFGAQNDEASNLIRWERYRTTMGFERD